MNANLQLGAGFNYAFEPDISGVVSLQIPDDVTLIEAGLAELKRIKAGSPAERRNLSLHLARTPIGESGAAQDIYVRYLQTAMDELRPEVRKRIVSIGVHLTGSRQVGNGLLGGADTYWPTDTQLNLARTFIVALQQAFHLPVWLENANFYSSNPSHALETWMHTRFLCEQTGCSAIIDFAHMHVEANNTGIDSVVLLGAVPWKHVIECHMSGITVSPDGSMHDGHNKAVHENVWALLEQALPLFPSDQILPIFTIEHTPPVWSEQANLFESDFGRLRSILMSRPTPLSFAPSGDKYMRGYLRYWVTGQIPLLGQACEQRKVSLSSLIDSWLAMLREGRCRAIFDYSEVPPEERDSSVEIVPSFLEYVKTELRKTEVCHG